ncbi:hypothetical protein AKJ57_03540 [candidate division MSBL1 archaeon SCGC-AAA259A05]|uniref:Tyr recombinase domain-containing protein n=1 Tax=candidate division MSBL1 archaeon SCGC-AAA259A05 TaxID=1698259 RepID=A0A133U9G4_9EURY|nr:hypothetical protein AKJ57_03540 [candidate division MSBL1 archaeon SCGC-AAA259A05]
MKVVKRPEERIGRLSRLTLAVLAAFFIAEAFIVQLFEDGLISQKVLTVLLALPVEEAIKGGIASLFGVLCLAPLIRGKDLKFEPITWAVLAGIFSGVLFALAESLMQGESLLALGAGLYTHSIWAVGVGIGCWLLVLYGDKTFLIGAYPVAVAGQKEKACLRPGFEPTNPYGTAPSTKLLEKVSSKEQGKVSFSEKTIDKFLNRLKAAGRSDMRIKRLKYGLKKLGKAVNWNCDINDITEYLNNRREEVSTRTLADEIQIIKQFFKDLGIQWIDRIKKPKVRKQKPKIIKKEDIQDFIEELSTADVEKKYFYRAKTAVILSAVSGMRPWEIYRLEWENINIENRTIRLPAEKTKTKEERIVIFNQEAKRHLDKLKELFPSQPFSTKTIYLLTGDMKPKPELKLKHCRKYFSQTWDREGLPTSIKEMLVGHFGSVDLRNYNGQSAEDLKEIYDKANIKVLEESDSSE